MSAAVSPKEDSAEAPKGAPEGEGAPVVPEVARSAPRVAAIDILRGIVMVLMSIDHASETFNGGRLFTDSFFFYTPGSALPAGQFFTRWITHLCAPTFVALAGTSLAISTESRRAKGHSERSIGRHILARGVLLIVFELVWMSWVMVGPGRFLFQVLWALGASLVLMAFLRRLGDRTLLALGVGLVLGSEVILGFFAGAGALDEIPVALFVSGGFFFDKKMIVAYPAVPWLAMMCIGWVFGRRLVAWRAEGKDELRLASRVVAIAGVIGLVLFLALRANDGYGNMRLLRESGGTGIVQWLHVSKYPPSATYTGLELGIAALLLAALMRLGSIIPRALEPLRLIGQTALFYYLLHIHALSLVAWAAGLHGKLGILASYVGGVAVVVALYPACAWFRRYKTAHPNGWARWI